MSWYLARAGQTHGPYPPEALAQMARDGHLFPGDMICRDGRTWQPIEQVVALPKDMAPASTRAPLRRKSGYLWLAGAAVIVVAAGVRFAMQWDTASAGRTDSVAKIEAGLQKLGVPKLLAEKAAPASRWPRRNSQACATRPGWTFRSFRDDCETSRLTRLARSAL
ncbi:MAG: DUF4339 domain-containing protein [Pirellulales bacterium]